MQKPAPTWRHERSRLDGSSTVPLRHGKQESPSSRPLSQATVIAIDAGLLQPRDCTDEPARRPRCCSAVKGVTRPRPITQAEMAAIGQRRPRPTALAGRPTRLKITRPSPNPGLAPWRARSPFCIGNVGATWLRRAGSRAAVFGARAHRRLTPNAAVSTPVAARATLEPSAWRVVACCKSIYAGAPGWERMPVGGAARSRVDRLRGASYTTGTRRSSSLASVELDERPPGVGVGVAFELIEGRRDPRVHRGWLTS
jgi:hypothetical protein